MKDQDIIKKIDEYLDRVIKSAYKKEGRKYDPLSISVKYIVVETHNKDLIMYPIHLWCAYNRVHWEVTRRLKKFMHESIGIYYDRIEPTDSADGSHVYFDKYEGQVDVNYTKASFNVDTGRRVKNINLSIFDEYYEDITPGEVMISSTYEKLIFNYYNMGAKEYKTIRETNGRDDPRLHLPDNFRHNWEDYYRLYVKTFGEDPCKYKIICGPGVKRVEVKINE